MEDEPLLLFAGVIKWPSRLRYVARDGFITDHLDRAERFIDPEAAQAAADAWLATKATAYSHLYPVGTVLALD